jgi:uncharacterized protein YpuA (DUF1002 family)
VHITRESTIKDLQDFAKSLTKQQETKKAIDKITNFFESLDNLVAL